jgi:hypothetical protein
MLLCLSPWSPILLIQNLIRHANMTDLLMTICLENVETFLLA